MARPAEKARAMLNKWVAMRDGEEGLQEKRRQQQRSKRPFLASECTNLADAERYRNQIVREISDLLSKLQNPAAPEHTLREWNDDVNKKLREKYHWNNQIYKLGGIDYNALEKKRRIEEGDVQIHYSYRYFGAAKNLPGVKELLEKEAAAHQNKSKSKQQKSSDNQSILRIEKMTLYTLLTFFNRRNRNIHFFLKTYIIHSGKRKRKLAITITKNLQIPNIQHFVKK